MGLDLRRRGLSRARLVRSCQRSAWKSSGSIMSILHGGSMPPFSAGSRSWSRFSGPLSSVQNILHVRERQARADGKQKSAMSLVSSDGSGPMKTPVAARWRFGAGSLMWVSNVGSERLRLQVRSRVLRLPAERLSELSRAVVARWRFDVGSLMWASDVNSERLRLQARSRVLRLLAERLSEPSGAISMLS